MAHGLAAALATVPQADVVIELGGEDAKRRLVGERLALVGRRGETAGADGIPVDSTGLPNSCRLPVTAVSSHNSYVSEEVRLICVVRGDTGPLLLFRHVAGSVIDADTVTRTIAEPGAMGMDTRFAVSGAHGEVVSGHLGGLEARGRAVTCDGRPACARCVPCALGSRDERRGYAYLCLDATMRRKPGRDATRRAAKGRLPPATPETASRRSSRSPGGAARPCPSASRRRRPSGGACPCASWSLRRPG